ncbi:MAG: hypothetical protein ACTSY1_03520 [Alphaproteobacteria bacterium]
MPDPKNDDLTLKTGSSDPVATYKEILRNVLDNRPSGTRQRLAAAIGKNRSFISQISSPTYPTPIPVEHVERIIELCHFAPSEREGFLAAYRAAHPRRFKRLERATERQLNLRVPDLGRDDLNRAFDRAMVEIAQRMARLMAGVQDEKGGRTGIDRKPIT